MDHDDVMAALHEAEMKLQAQFDEEEQLGDRFAEAARLSPASLSPEAAPWEPGGAVRPAPTEPGTCTFVDTAGTSVTLRRITTTWNGGMFNNSRTFFELVRPAGNFELASSAVAFDPRTWTVTLDGRQHLLAVDEQMRRSVLETIGGEFPPWDLDSLDFGAVAGVPAATPARKKATIARFETWGGGRYKYGMQLGDADCAAFIDDADVVRAAMRAPVHDNEDSKQGGPFRFAGAGLCADRAFVLEMASLNGCVLQHAAPGLRDDAEIARAAVASAPRALQWLGPTARADVVFLLEAFVRPGHLREIGKFGEPALLSAEQLLRHAPRASLSEVSGGRQGL